MADICKPIQRPTPLLDSISNHDDLEKLDSGEFADLTDEMRQEITRVICRPDEPASSATETVPTPAKPVELLVGLHYVLNASAVKIILAGEHQDFAKNILPQEHTDDDILEQAELFFEQSETAEKDQDDFNNNHCPTSASAILKIPCTPAPPKKKKNTPW